MAAHTCPSFGTNGRRVASVTLSLEIRTMTQERQHRPLPQSRIANEGCYVLEAFNPPPVTADSSAIQVMTDLARVAPATISGDALVDEANKSMILRGVRLLLVVDEKLRISGVIASADILGEKTLRVSQQRGLRRDELRVSDLMSPVDEMEALDITQVQRATVGAVFATLKAHARAHALVVGAGPDGRQALLGIFSASQIARQLGVPIHSHEMARTFAEIEAVIVGA